MIQLYTINIRRDAHTTTPVDVPEHEVSLLQEMFGAENVHNMDGKLIEDEGLGNSVGEFTQGDDEYGRLCAKYGGELVESVYGKRATKGLDNAIASTKKTKQAPVQPKATQPKATQPKATQPKAEQVPEAKE